MRTYLAGKTSCQGLLVHYYLLEENSGTERSYGLRVEYGGDRAEVRDLTPLSDQAMALLESMYRGGVTPVTVRDIVEDWLLR